jgi:hypothetical protein
MSKAFLRECKSPRLSGRGEETLHREPFGVLAVPGGLPAIVGGLLL